MFGIYEDLYGASDIGAGHYIVLIVVAFMLLRGARAALKELLIQYRYYPLYACIIAFWWLAFSGKPIVGVAVMMAGIVSTVLLNPSPEEKEVQARAEETLRPEK